jgi:hypothetical protein
VKVQLCSVHAVLAAGMIVRSSVSPNSLNMNCRIRQRWCAAAAFMALLGTVHAEKAPIAAQVPFVGCPGIGGADPGPWPVPTDAPKVLPSQPKVPAGRIAYYRAVDGPGVFAPRGWHCRAWGGANGAFIIVSPTAPPAVIPREPVTGPGVIAIWSPGSTSGRYEVAEVSVRVFPKVMADFIARVKAEGFPSPDFSRIKSFPDDQYTYLTPKLVEFTTPAHQQGIGTGIFMPSTDPVRGIVSLSPGDGRYPDLVEFDIRLSSSENKLSRALIELELQCLNGSWPSC